MKKQVIFTIGFIFAITFLIGGVAAAFYSNGYINISSTISKSGAAATDEWPRTPDGAIDWAVFTTYDPATDTCCCTQYNTDEECDHANICPDCGECIDCGDCRCDDIDENGCNDCDCDDCEKCDCDNCECDDCNSCNAGRQCGQCDKCNPVTLNDGTLIYNGMQQTLTAVINSDIDHIRYQYEPDTDTGAELGSDGLPWRAGWYRVIATYQSSYGTKTTQAYLQIEPAILNVLYISIDNKIFDGTINASYVPGSRRYISLSGKFPDDDVVISVLGDPSFYSPDIGTEIPVSFTDFEIGGAHAWNYVLIQPERSSANITRAGIEIIIDDNDLIIGGNLPCSSPDVDISNYNYQWYIDDEPVPGANGKTYKVRPGDADKRISVKVESPCGNLEGESEQTVYVPYTINIIEGGTAIPMEGDYAYFNNPGNYTAYAASINNGFVDINYELRNSGFGTDNIIYTGGDVEGVDSAGSDISRYYIDPADAIDGVITITATFYHRGITIMPSGAHTFSDADCGAADPNETHTIIITQLGNASTGPLSVRRGGDYPYEFTASAYTIPDIGVGENYELDVRVELGSSPQDLGGYTYSGTVIIDGENISQHIIPLNVRVYHTFGQFIYRGSFHDHTCTNCSIYAYGDCVYSPWSTVSASHQRSCNICLGVDSHSPIWSLWAQGSVTQHTRNCTVCAIQNTADHIWGNWGAWTQGDTANHTRTGSCTECSRPGGSQSAVHTWGNWGAWTQGDANNHTRTGSCTVCSRPGGSQSATHSWSAWTSINNTYHRRTCSACARSETVNHNFYSTFTYNGYQSTTDHAAHVHRIHSVCSTCSHVEQGGETYCVFNSSSMLCVASSFPNQTVIAINSGCGNRYTPVPGRIMLNLFTP